MHRKKPDIDRVFHALGDPSRRAIVEKLSEGPLSVSRLAEPLDITLAAVVQHLQGLADRQVGDADAGANPRPWRRPPAQSAAPLGPGAMSQMQPVTT